MHGGGLQKKKEIRKMTEKKKTPRSTRRTIPDGFWKAEITDARRKTGIDPHTRYPTVEVMLHVSFTDRKGLEGDKVIPWHYSERSLGFLAAAAQLDEGATSEAWLGRMTEEDTRQLIGAHVYVKIGRKQTTLWDHPYTYYDQVYRIAKDRAWERVEEEEAPEEITEAEAMEELERLEDATEDIAAAYVVDLVRKAQDYMAG